MTTEEFWKLIESTKDSDPEAQAETLVENLVKLEPAEILAFGHMWDQYHGEAYTWKLWAAAYIMNGGCSDDSFMDFRSWLLLQGQSVYEAALKDADTLASVKCEPDEASCECYPAAEAYCAVTASDDHHVYYDALEAAHGGRENSDVPAGEEWDFDDEEEMKYRMPKLYKKFSIDS